MSHKVIYYPLFYNKFNYFKYYCYNNKFYIGKNCIFNIKKLKKLIFIALKNVKYSKNLKSYIAI